MLLLSLLFNFYTSLGFLIKETVTFFLKMGLYKVLVESVLPNRDPGQLNLLIQLI